MLSSERGRGSLAEIHQHHAGGDQADTDQLRGLQQLAVSEAPHQHDHHGADAAPQRIGDPQRNAHHHLGEQAHGDGVGQKHQQRRQRSGHAFRQAQAGGADHLGADRQQQQGPGVIHSRVEPMASRAPSLGLTQRRTLDPGRDSAAA